MTESLCAHLLLGGITQVTIGADINGQPTFLCLDCGVKHVLDLMLVHQLETPEIAEMVNLEICGHFGDVVCGCCMSALNARLTEIALQARLQRPNGNLQRRIKKLLAVWFKRYGNLNINRVVIKDIDDEEDTN